MLVQTQVLRLQRHLPRRFIEASPTSRASYWASAVTLGPISPPFWSVTGCNNRPADRNATSGCRRGLVLPASRSSSAARSCRSRWGRDMVMTEAPGLKRKRNQDGTYRWYWEARTDLVKRGYRPSMVRLHYSETEDGGHQRAARCR